MTNELGLRREKYQLKKSPLTTFGKIYFWALIALFFAFALYGSLHFSFGANNGAPDERTRMTVVNFIANYLHLPYGTETAVRIPVWGFSYAFQPYFPSIIAAFFVKAGHFLLQQPLDYSPTAFSRLSFSVFARFVSMGSGLAVIALALQIGKKLFDRQAPILFFCTLSALLPQFFYLSTYFNNDAFSVFTTYLIFYAWLRGKEDGWSWLTAFLLSVGLALTLLTYYFAGAFVFCSVIIFNVTYLQAHKKDYKGLIKKELFIILLVFLMAGWFFIWNYLKFHDFLGTSISNHFGELYGQGNFKPSLRQTPEHLHQDIWQMLWSDNASLPSWARGTSWLSVSLKSFLGVFGPLAFPMKAWMYQFYVGLLSLGLGLGVIYSFIKKRLLSPIFFLSLLACMVIPFLFSVYYSFFSDYQPQGRYFISAMLPLLVLVTVGYEGVLSRLKEWIKFDLTYLLMWAYLLVFVLVFFNVILPALT
ncbi:hypothetical protein [Lactococcus termiticola]|uniref:Glycosyltransferase RgtA/B/C/D-like domain-containing protein n=1 Tax=Lactococcus termiticola TaxID=2169526 RepID=A0A2R5HGD6_9LACT|nr:hypothetical protein [Lactococcus termiticola]GBG96916.1 hypothetical protein NtB2_01051 [Lactococcus termiticola]